MFYNPVYKCKLLVIDPEARVNADQSFKTNIANAKAQETIEVMVQRDIWSFEYFREIITKKKIPTYHVSTYTIEGKDPEVYLPRKPYYIRYNETRGIEDTFIDDDLVEATPAEIEEYIDEHPNKDDFDAILTSFFQRAERDYKKAESAGVVSDKAQVKRLLKSLKKQ